jgi:serine/threonine protein kinase/tetratricopeptide (TPR) repeat protein
VLPPDETPQEIDGRFRREGERIAGGMGMVYRGVDLTTGETVAIKISTSFGSQLGERFMQEAHCLAALAHPAIVRYIAHGKTLENEHYLVMEWLDGETLEDRLARGPIPLGAIVQMARRVSEALAAAHHHGVIHRDIKPANIFLPSRDLSKIKLLDFGIARRLFDLPSMRLTQAGSALGTPMYMSPEQAQGSLEVDARADIFSLGCVLYECLTGAPPFMADTATGSLALAAGNEDIDVESKCAGAPKRIVRLIQRMVSKDPAKRPGSMEEVLADLGKLTAELRSTGALPQVGRPRRTPVDGSFLVATGERRLVAIIIAAPKEATPPKVHLDPAATVDLGNVLAKNLSDAEFDDSRLSLLSSEIAPFGARIRRIAGGAMAVTLTGDVQTTPLDLASRASRCALKLKSARPDLALAISLGHAVKDEDLRTEHLIEAAQQMVAGQKPSSIHVDKEIKRLLDARFEIVSDDEGRNRLLFEKGLREAPRTVLGREVPCLGREREVRELQSFFDACVEEPQAEVVILTGTAGCGKSRVAYEFLERMRDGGQSFELLIGRGDPMRGNVSLGLVAQAIRGACGITGTEPDDVQHKRLFAHTSRYLPKESAPTTVAFLGEITNIRFPDDDLPQLKAARRDARLMADQTVGAWVDWLEAEAKHHPVLLLFEDLHWGDFASVNYVDHALRVLRKKPVMVVALARPEIDERFFGLWRDRHCQRISIAPLGKRASQELVRKVLGDVPQEKVDWLLDHAQGNPFYLEELIRAVAEQGPAASVPETVLDFVRMRFDAVGDGAKLVLRAASIYGQSFSAEGVKAIIAEMHDEDVDRWLEILVDKEILFSRPLGEQRQHVFRHALFHQSSYAMLNEEDEISGHLLAGEFLEEQGERDAMVLADHYEKGKKPERAVRWLRVAANQAMEVDDFKAAIARVERGVRLGASGDDRAELKCVEAEARYWTGEYVEAEKAAREAQKCEDAKLRLRATSALIQALGPQTKYREIESIAKKLEPKPEEPALLTAWLNALFNASAFLASAGQFERRKRILALLESERDRLDPVLIGRIETTKAHIAWNDGRPAEHVNGFLLAWSYFEQAGHRRAGSEALGNAGSGLLEIGQAEEAERQLRKLWEIAERMGLRGLFNGIFYLLGGALAYQGHLGDARSFARQAVDMSAEANDQYWGTYAYCCLSVIEHMAGNSVLAEEHANCALRMLDNPSLRPFICALQSRCLLGQGRNSEAYDCAKDAYEQMNLFGNVADGEAMIHLAYAESLIAIGDRAYAAKILAKAMKHLEARASTIDRPDWRESFLGRIPEHRRTLDLADELGVTPHRLGEQE